jgi:hypothetical protein
MSNFLTPANAFIFRIVHIDNMEWILDNGLHCQNSDTQDPDFEDVGHKEIIGRRKKRTVDVEPSGTLSDYIPFYFTPWSVMLYNIVTGHNVPQKTPDEIIMLVSKLSIVKEHKIPFVFTDSHALLASARFFNKIADLETAVDWEVLKKKDFKRDNEDPGKLERYQAEALVYQHLPLSAFGCIACATEGTTKKITAMVEKRNLCIKVITKPEWFFQ